MDKEPFRMMAQAGRKFLTGPEEDRYWYLFAEKQQGMICDVMPKPFKLYLTDPSPTGKQRLTYEPDFLIVEKSGSVWCEEVKAARKDGKPIYMGNARDKVLTAARVHPWFYFRVVWRFKGEWKEDVL